MKRFTAAGWKKKNRMLLAGALLLGWLVYTFAIRNTIETRSACSAIEARLDSAAGAPERLRQLQQELRELESSGGENDTSRTLHEKLLGIVSPYCSEHRITLRDFAPPVRYRTGDWEIETHPFTVQGEYIPLLKLLHHIEKEKCGKVISADFHSKQDAKTKELTLTLTVYVQNIIRDKS